MSKTNTAPSTALNLVSPRDAGRRLGVTTGRVIQLAKDGRLPELRDSSGRRFFRLADVEQLAKAREAKRGNREAAK